MSTHYWHLASTVKSDASMHILDQTWIDLFCLQFPRKSTAFWMHFWRNTNIQWDMWVVFGKQSSTKSLTCHRIYNYRKPLSFLSFSFSAWAFSQKINVYVNFIIQYSNFCGIFGKGFSIFIPLETLIKLLKILLLIASFVLEFFIEMNPRFSYWMIP